ncbi:hypothetical protein H310_08841 [Aphanomyces invadans]|uniref:Uncharacterized protein n=1 Tax=Aphanomyces invadans TaxID=157072 RepID=A0A024TWS6_9STRA|nr:hypothetical protein H310_08841 [Aphanomyces invadans]ETV98096.1 hypothetical protein H310_08841 [Aphanomyces invadans]|eukprot:XP_008872971.1 hypothetical protein H310_08841 [Aphanomyces invadans]
MARGIAPSFLTPASPFRRALAWATRETVAGRRGSEPVLATCTEERNWTKYVIMIVVATDCFDNLHLALGQTHKRPLRAPRSTQHSVRASRRLLGAQHNAWLYLSCLSSGTRYNRR